MNRAIVAGHVCVDLMPQLAGLPSTAPGSLVDIGPLIMRPGGCVANTGGALAALGATVRLFADVGEDDLGRLVRGMLASTGGMDLTGIQVVAGATTSYSVVLDPPDSDRMFWHHVGANASFDGSRVDVSGADLLHLGYPPVLPKLYADGGARLLDMLARAHRAGVTTSVDMSTLDPRSEAAAVNWQELLAKALPSIDVFTPSVDDLIAALSPSTTDHHADVRTMGQSAIDLGAAVVLLTDGPRGMHLFTAGTTRLADAGACLAGRADWPDQELFVPADHVPNARATGAGDSAAAGLIYGILTGAGPAAALRFAAAAAADAVSGSSPSRTTLERALLNKDL